MSVWVCDILVQEAYFSFVVLIYAADGWRRCYDVFKKYILLFAKDVYARDVQENEMKSKFDWVQPTAIKLF